MNGSPVLGNPSFGDVSVELILIAFVGIPFFALVTATVVLISCFKLRRHASAVWRWLPTLVPLTALFGLLPCLFFSEGSGILLWAIMAAAIVFVLLGYLAIRLGPTQTEIQKQNIN